MKLSINSLLWLLPVTSALPTETSEMSLVKRQSAQAVTDQLLFSITLPQFTTRRNARNPGTLDWSSDGCTSSPDNPLGFPLVPACHRHDFGYHNYRAQSRFTKANKLKIDDNFKDDLYYQCSLGSFKTICKGLAEVYYAAVRAFGGGDALSKRDEHEELVKIYEEKLSIYQNMLEEARKNGDIPAAK